jgi:N-acetylglucosaminyldiphosphoundecaprenol N-acetyl-beta-D-mannosaminyltransferase
MELSTATPSALPAVRETPASDLTATGGGTRVRLLGLELDRVTEAEAIGKILRGLAAGRGGVVVTPNLDHLRQLARRPELESLYRQADLVVADGMPLVWASRMQGLALPERVAGSELVWSLTAEAALRDKSIFLLGGAPGACEAAEERLRECYPGARFAGRLCPPMGFEYNPGEIEKIRTTLREAQPDIVYVALGFPKQERLTAYLQSEFPNMWFLGVGFSLSFVSGQVRRAPAWMIRMGLEWLHRLLQDPRRLARRYLARDLPFAARLFGHALKNRLLKRNVEAEAPPDPGGPDAGVERVVFAYGSLERGRAELLAELLDENDAPLLDP